MAKKFRFSLQSVLEHRERLRDSAQAVLAKAQAELLRRQESRVILQKELQEMVQERSQVMSPQMMVAQVVWIGDLKRRIELADQEISKQKLEVEHCRQLLVERSKEFRAMEILRDQQKEEFKKAERKIENKFMNEVASVRFGSLETLMSMLVLVCMVSLHAGTRTASIFNDFGGTVSDTLQVNPNLNQGLVIALDTTLFLPSMDTAINNAFPNPIASERFGSMPLVSMGPTGYFKTMFLWYFRETSKPTNVQPFYNFHIVADVNLEAHTLQVVDTAGFSNFSNANNLYRTFYGGGSSPNKYSVPTFPEFSSQGNRWLAQWSNDTTFLGPAARSSWQQTIPTGQGTETRYLLWHCSAPPVIPGGCSQDTLKGGGTAQTRNFLRMAMAPLGFGMDTLITVHGPSRSHAGTSIWPYISIRWERMPTSFMFAIDSIALPTYHGLYHVAVASDSSKRVLIGYTDATGQTLNLVAYDNNFTTGSPTRIGQTVVPVSIDISATRADTMSRNFSITSLANHSFAITYARSSVIYFRTVDLFGGSISLSAEQRVSLPGTCSNPDIAANSRYMAVSFIRNNSGLRPEMVRFTRNGSLGFTSDTLVRNYVGSPLTYSTILNNVSPANVRMASNLHIPSRPSVAVDTTGSVLMGFNQERNARLVGFRTRKIYLPNAQWRSLPLDLLGPGVVDPIVAGDSVRFLSSSFYGTSVNSATLTVERNAVNLSPVGTGQYDASGTFRYKVALNRVDSFVSPKIDSMTLQWNLQPRLPVAQTIRIGSEPAEPYQSSTLYHVINRRDSVHLAISAQDLDNPAGLTLRTRTFYVSPRAGIAQSYSYSDDRPLSSVGSGNYEGVLSIPPQNAVIDSLVLHIYTDDGNWTSPILTLRLKYRDPVPEDQLNVQWKDGQGVTLNEAVISGRVIRTQMNDSALVKVFIADSNDAQVWVRWNIRDASGSLKLDSVLMNVPDTFRLRMPQDALDRNPARIPRADSLELAPDTLYLSIRDPDTTLLRTLIFVPNHWPKLDSVSVVSYYNGSVRRDTLVGRWRSGDDPAFLSVTPGTPVRLVSHGRDVDTVNQDQISREWQVLLQDPVNKSQWIVDETTSADTLQYTFPSNPAYQLAMVRILHTDITMGMSSDTLLIVYPRVDTVGGWELSLTYLQDSLRFVLGSSKLSATRRVELRNIGSLDLDILSVRTGKNDGAWLDYLVERNGLATVQDNTHVNRISVPIRLAPGESLPIELMFNVAGMTGDQTVLDSIYIGTNDFLNPVVAVPFRVRWDDLPQIRYSTRLITSSDSAIPLRPYFPVNHSLIFSFTEPIRKDSVRNSIQIYSRLDSAARGAPGITEMESAYSGQYSYRSSLTGTRGNTYVDTVIFTPYYRSPSDHFNTTPPPYLFLRADHVGIRVRNGIVDSSGNPLDLRGTRVLYTPGTQDTLIRALVDTSTLQVLQTWPAQDGIFNPDEDIRILFSKPLSEYSVFGLDTFLALDLRTLEGDSNLSIQLRSRYSQRLRMDFRSLRLERGDSMLVIRPRYKFLSQDSVTVWIAPSLASSLGHTLDGNADRLTQWPVDSTDAYQFRFVVGASKFYVFPNPYKASIAEHREKGSITFKNLHQIRGITLDRDIEIRIHTISGTLVYSSDRKKENLFFRDDEFRPPEFEWPLVNNHGRQVASGVYLFSVSQKGKVLFKNKLVVIR